MGRVLTKTAVNVNEAIRHCGTAHRTFQEMKRHVDIGASILSLVRFPYPAAPTCD